MTRERLRRIRDAVTALSTASPSTENPDICWYLVDRCNPNYYQLGRMSESPDPLYDVWADIGAEIDTDGHVHVSATVVLYDIRADHQELTHTIFDEEFDGYNQPLEQTFLNNIGTYQEQLQQRINDAVETAEALTETGTTTPVP